jgi:hypothetical protein
VAGVAGADALRSKRAPGRDPGFTYLASFVVLGLGLTFLGPVLTTLRDQIGVSTATISILFGAQSLGYLAGAVLSGRGYSASAIGSWPGRSSVQPSCSSSSRWRLAGGPHRLLRAARAERLDRRRRRQRPARMDCGALVSGR